MEGAPRADVFCIDAVASSAGIDLAGHTIGLEGVGAYDDQSVAEDVGVDLVAQLRWEVEKWVNVGFPGGATRAG